MTQDMAMVRVFLERETGNAVSDDRVQQTYDKIKENAETEIPPLEDVRPQIEQHLRQEAYADLSKRLQNETQIVFYEPDGEPQRVTAGTAEKASGEMEGSEPSEGTGSSK
ncbi:hypothetical protein [Roseivivax sp. CAU 1761]